MRNVCSNDCNAITAPSTAQGYRWGGGSHQISPLHNHSRNLDVADDGADHALLASVFARQYLYRVAAQDVPLAALEHALQRFFDDPHAAERPEFMLSCCWEARAAVADGNQVVLQTPLHCQAQCPAATARARSSSCHRFNQ